MAYSSHSNRYDNDLRRFALDLYAAPGVESACLCLQDEAGLDVCALLWRCWLAHRGRRATETMTPKLVKAERWQREMTLPLRQRRRWLKTQTSERPGLETLRSLLKRAELESEMETLSQLEALGAMAEPVAGDAFAGVRAHYALHAPGPQRALETVIAAARAPDAAGTGEKP